MIVVQHSPNLESTYALRFPISELSNAIALCGWTLANKLPQTAEVQAEIARLESLPYLDIPDGRNWYAQFATKVD